MSNTLTRIISAIVIVCLILVIVSLGVTASILFVYFLGLLVSYEFNKNIFKVKGRWVFVNIAVYSLFLPLNFLDIFTSLHLLIVYFGIALNLSLIIFLFFRSMDTSFLLKAFKFPITSGLYLLITFSCIGFIFHTENWKVHLLGFLLLTSLTDVLAWFFGKNFGKHKLWKEVSPNKTIEGLVGGVFGTSLIVAVLDHLFSLNIPLGYYLFPILCLSSQVGDLVQSKVKRIYKIKDSSTLIPGHGGVYDRVDAHLFVAPIYAFFLSLYI